MKKLMYICLLCILILAGCTSDNTNKTWDEEHRLNSLNHTIFEKEDSVDVFINVNGNSVLYSLDIDKNTLHQEKKNIHFQKSAVTDVMYYKNNYYHLGVDSEDGKTLKAKLYVSDLKGNKPTLVYEVAEKELNVEETLDLPKLVIHKDKIYMIVFDSLYIGGLEEKPYKVELENIWNVFVQDDTLYVFSSEYADTPWTLLECDLKGNVKNVLYDHVLVTYVDESFMFYKKTGVEEQEKLYILNRENNEEIFVEDTLNCYGVLYEDGIYVFETRKNGYTTRTINVMNEEGKITSKNHNETLTIELLKNHKIYVNGGGIKDNYIGYFEIKENEISDLLKLE